VKNYVLYFTKPHAVQVREEPIPTPAQNEVLVKNMVSGISAGTEMLCYKGLIPDDISLDETISSLKHQISYPFKYGYSSVGKIVEVGHPNLNYLIDKLVFVFNPHESYFCVNKEQLILLPDNLSPQDALFIPTMETAVNLLLDGSPLIGENVLVLGLGVVGLLTTALLQQFPLSTLIGIDLSQNRRKLGLELGAKFAFDNQPDLQLQLQKQLQHLKHRELDLIYELTGNPDALNSAISLIGYEGRIVLGSWYGKKPCHINLGGKFHRNRIKVIASQVSSLASKLQGRWTKDRRFNTAFAMLEKIKPTRFVSHNFHITQADKAYDLLDAKAQEALFVTLTYEG
jgi:2-desacetyl-2-hydroxyethyl bacteriochlorophyllide A dehydrogenase